MKIKIDGTILYKVSTKKIYGKRLWILIIGGHFIYGLFTYFESDGIANWFSTEFWNFIGFTILYYLVAIYSFTKTFLMTTKGIYIIWRIFRLNIFYRHFSLFDIKRLTVTTNEHFMLGKVKGNMKFRKGKWIWPITIPILKKNPKDVYKLLIKESFDPGPRIIYHEKSNNYIPIKGWFLIGRNMFNGILKKDKGLGGQHAKLFSEGNQLFITDLDSVNGTLVNGKEIKPGLKYPISLGDKIQSSLQLFRILTFDFRQGREIEFESINNLGLFIQFYRYGLQLILWSTFVSFIYVFYFITIHSELKKSCEEGNLNRCLSNGQGHYQNGNWNKAYSLFKKSCDGDDLEFAKKPSSCYLAGITAGLLNDGRSHNNYLRKSCKMDYWPACVRWGILTGKRKYEKAGIEIIQKKCDSSDSLACKELTNLYTLMGNFDLAFKSLVLAFKLNYYNLYWLQIDPELSHLRETAPFKSIWQKIEKRETEKEKKELNFLSEKYIEYLKYKTFVPYHKSNISQTCSKIQNEMKTCFLLLRDPLIKYMEIVNFRRILNARSYVRAVFIKDSESENQIRKWNNLIDQLDFNILSRQYLEKKKYESITSLFDYLIFKYKSLDDINKKNVTIIHTIEKVLGISGLLGEEEEVDEESLMNVTSFRASNEEETKELDELKLRLVSLSNQHIETNKSYLEKKKDQLKLVLRNFIIKQLRERIPPDVREKILELLEEF